jgi:hypothetical protein
MVRLPAGPPYIASARNAQKTHLPTVTPLLHIRNLAMATPVSTALALSKCATTLKSVIYKHGVRYGRRENVFSGEREGGNCRNVATNNLRIILQI